jgi:hypothetical protein
MLNPRPGDECSARLRDALENAENRGAMAEQAAICASLDKAAEQEEADLRPDGAAAIRAWVESCRGPDRYTRQSAPWSDTVAALHGLCVCFQKLQSWFDRTRALSGEEAHDVRNILFVATTWVSVAEHKEKA